MSKAFPRPRLRTIESRNRLASGVSSRSMAVAGDPHLDPRLPAPLDGGDGSPPSSPTENPQYASASELDRLHASLDDVTPESHPRTAKLLGSGTRKTAQKVIEEAGEVALEAAKHHPRGVVRESADLLYHLIVLWRRTGVDPGDVWNEMRRRADAFGIAEKLPKSPGRNAPAPDANR
jgi:phosphoribosyl-ATP pyrophosphohydrolase